MKNQKLGSRLMTAAALVCNGKTVCDVGCDHGKLSLYLVQSGRARNVIATDINKMPLQKAVELFRENNLSDKAVFLLTDGLQGLTETEDITHVVIAGLGGDTISQIIENAPFIKAHRTQLVLLPAQSGEKVREYLAGHGFEITSETCIEENKKYYSAMCAVYTGEDYPCDTYSCHIGKSGNCTGSAAKGYFNMVLSRLEKRAKGLVIDTGSCPEDILQAIEKIKSLI